MFWIVLTAVGCGGAEVRDERPDWDDVSTSTIAVTDPTELPLLCPFERIAVDGEIRGGWSVECIKALEAYEIVSEANLEIATLNASALRKTEAGYNQLIHAGEMEQQLGEFYLELLKEEKREHFWDNVLHKALLIIGVGVGIAN